ncbi:hypothetical protein HF086_012687 [Spodoptera exigua]|uniref:Uncharacterized protein n=1 Tax=Spodoptera exigua TaxID=7107 RepID=A0A922SET5_SPOEX|nr:hypothetical protein HF086_012687 [Spodoptera exigua]
MHAFPHLILIFIIFKKKYLLVGVDNDGKIQYLNATIVQDNGCSNNENILDFVAGGFPNCYNTEYWSLKTATVTTDTPSNSFARAPGTCEGITSIEHIMQHIAFAVQKDPTSVRKANMRTEDNDLPEMIETLKKDADYDRRAKEIEQFNKTNRWMKKSISCNVMCFPVIFYGNYSALVSIYRGDGTVTVSTGGIEMGQGINTKCAQVCAYELGIPLEYVKIVPNQTYIAANNVFSGSSITTESCVYAIIKACEVLKERLAPIKESMPDATWKEIIQKAGEDQVDLTSLYMMKDSDENLKACGEMGICSAHGVMHALRQCIMESRKDSGYDPNEWIYILFGFGVLLQRLGDHDCRRHWQCLGWVQRGPEAFGGVQWPIMDTMTSFGVDASPELCQKVRDIEEASPCSKNLRSCQRKCSETSDCSDWSVLTEEKDLAKSAIALNFGKSKFFKVYHKDDIFDILNKIIIDISEVASLKKYEYDQNLILGANVSIEDCIRIFKEASSKKSEFAYLSEIVKHLELVAHIPVRKIMPRNQNALAIVNAAYLIELGKKNTIESASIVYGNIDPDFVHATKTEEFLVGKNIFTNETLQEAINMLSCELVPVDIPGEPSIECRKKLAIAPAGRANQRFTSGGSLFKRVVSRGKEDYQTDRSLFPLNQPVNKMEGIMQASGEATYTNDIPPMPREKMDGVVAIFTPKDIPGVNSFTVPGLPLQTEDEEILADDVKYYGQPIAILVAETEKLAETLAKKVKVTYKNVSSAPPVLTIDEAKKDSRRYVAGGPSIERVSRGNKTTKIIKGIYNIEAQYPYYIEPITCVVVPVDDKLEVYDSTQWMDLTQNAIARSLGIHESDILVQVRRVGGGFGGKVSRNALAATACALVAKKLDRPCRFILPLQTNLTATGRRLPCQCDYEVGVDDDGKIQYLNATIIEDNGCSNNEDMLEYSVSAFPNCYDKDTWSLKSATVTTDTPSNTWVRGPGTVEGITCIEHIMQHIAFAVNKDPIAVRQINMRSQDNDLPELIENYKKEVDYDRRVKEIEQFNQTNRWMKKAISCNVMSWPVIYYGNYSALVSIYRGDGTVTVSTGGIEMGQGINTKCAQVCAYELGVPLEYVKIVPNHSFVAANNVFSGSSITTESCAYAIIRACEKLKANLAPIREKMPGATWKEIVQKAGEEQVDLTSLFMMKDTDENLKPYSAFAVAFIEVLLDVTTGRYQIARVDIMEDVGISANPKLDVGQVQGAYVQGMGYYTCEKIVYDKKTGKMEANRSLKYHVPLALDTPVEYNVKLRYNSKNPKGVLGSKTCGEMGVGIAHGITHALRQCIMESRKDSGYDPNEFIYIPVPYDTETILKALDVRLEEFVFNPSI